MRESCLSNTQDPAQLHRYCVEFLKDWFSDRSCSFCTWQIYSDSLMEWSCILTFMRVTPRYYGSCAPDAAAALQQRISTCVVRTLEWMQASRLQLNAAKTEQLWCAPPRKQEYLPNIPLLICSDTIQPVRCVRNLGIYVDSDLSMKSHISKAVSKCFAALRRLRGIRRLVSQPVLLSLVTSLIMTRFDYGSATLTGLPSHLLDRLQSLLNAAARLVCYAQNCDHVTHLLRDLHWLQVPERIQFRLAVLVFRCRNSMAPPYLLRDLQWTDEAESLRRLRSGAQQRLIVSRTQLRTIGDGSFRVTVASAWNSLPTTVTTATSLACFKKQLKHFFSQSRSRNFSDRCPSVTSPCCDTRTQYAFHLSAICAASVKFSPVADWLHCRRG